MKKILLLLCIVFAASAFAQCPAGESELTIAITPDNWPQETSWDVKNSLGLSIASGDATGGVICVNEDDCFIVTIYDSYGDGIFDPGGYAILLNGEEVASGSEDFDEEVSHYVNCMQGMTCELTIPVVPGNYMAGSQNHWFSFTPEETGLYEVSTCGSGCNSAIWIYEACQPVDYSADGAIAFDDNSCDTEAGLLQMGLIGGTTYYIRIGSEDESCVDYGWSFIHLGEFNPCEEIPGTVEVVVDIQPDNYPNETSWALTDSEGNTLASGGAQGATVCVDSSACIIFTINDSYGDGIFSPGGYSFYYDGELIGSGNNFGYGTYEEVGCPEGVSCNSPEDIDEGIYETTTGSHWYTFTPEITGSYLISTCELSSCNTRIQVYDYCNMANFDNTQVAAIYFNEENETCGEQAWLNAGMEAGVTYWIRISEVDEDCAGLINWFLEYNGPVEGCTDPNACNFDPLAEISDDSCLYPGDPECPEGPDLVIDEDYLQSSIYASSITVGETDCYINEGCLNGYGTRDLIRFGTRIDNIGTQDYYIGNPNTTPQMFTYDNCHNHNHVDSYAEYLLYDLDGSAIPVGFKFGFCVMDLTCDLGGTAQYGCSTQGISSMCSDIYSSGLSCQWIDVTDVPDGTYTMVVRINWEGTPDGLGNHEMSYTNNWGQACISIDRSSGSLEVDLVDGCEPMVDCAGDIYGNAQPDCNGDCNGTALRGDLDDNSEQNLVDAHLYVDQILGNDITASACTDLDQDNEITVTDAALMARCDIFNVAHEHPDSSGVHSHCDFPAPHLVNPFDTVTFNMTNINLEENYFDLMIKNPYNEIVGLQLEISGADITDIEMLYDAEIYPVAPEFMYGGQTLILLSYEDSLINKNMGYVSLCRVHFTNAGPEICIAEVVDVVNEDYENTITAIDKNCLLSTGISKNHNDFQTSLAPNPMTDNAVLEFNNRGNEILQLDILDLSGRVIRSHKNLTGNRFVIDRGTLAPGAYLYRLSASNGESIGRLVVQ